MGKKSREPQPGGQTGSPRASPLVRVFRPLCHVVDRKSRTEFQSLPALETTKIDVLWALTERNSSARNKIRCCDVG